MTNIKNFNSFINEVAKDKYYRDFFKDYKYEDVILYLKGLIADKVDNRTDYRRSIALIDKMSEYSEFVDIIKIIEKYLGKEDEEMIDDISIIVKRHMNKK